MARYISVWNVVEYTFTCTIPCQEGMGLTVTFVYCSMSIQFLLLWPSYHSSASPFSLSLPPNLLSSLTPLTLLSPCLLPPSDPGYEPGTGESSSNAMQVVLLVLVWMVIAVVMFLLRCVPHPMAYMYAY